MRLSAARRRVRGQGGGGEMGMGIGKGIAGILRASKLGSFC